MASTNLDLIPIRLDASSSVIPRPRLLNLLEDRGETLVTVIAAPAGYGKSTLVSQWAERTDHPVAWISLSPSSNSIDAFVVSIHVAISRAMDEPNNPRSSSIDALMRRFEDLAAITRELTLIFDDYHHIESRDVHDAMDALLALSPPNISIIVLSRHEVPLSLARLRADGKVRQLGDLDLAFTQCEVSELVNKVAPGRLSTEQVATLSQRSAGWIAGVRLAIASLGHENPDDIPSIVDSWTANRWLDDYVIEEVLNAQSPEVRQFVLQTSMLNWLEPDLCNYVLEIDNSAALIAEVSRNLVFVRSDEGHDGAIVYHSLFMDSVLRIAERDYPASHIRALRRRAAVWFQSQEQFEQAIDLALAAGDFEIVERCLRVVGNALMDGDHHHSRLILLQKLPEDRLVADPQFARWYISVLQYTGQLRKAMSLFDVVEPMWEGSGDSTQLGYVASCRAFFAMHSGDHEVAHRYAIEALHHYPLDCYVERMHAWSALSHFEFNLGHDDVVEMAHRQAASCRDYLPEEQRWWTLQVEVGQPIRMALRGYLKTAEIVYREQLGRLPANYRSHEGWFRFALAAISLERNDLECAMAEIECIERDLDNSPHHLWYPEALLVAAQVYAAVGDEERHDAALCRVRTMYETYGGGTVLDRLEATEVSAWLRRGELERARLWAARKRIDKYQWSRAFGDADARIVLIRIDIATGVVKRAEDRLQILVDQAMTSKRWAELVPLLMWQVVAHCEQGHVQDAVISLRAALQYGRPGGFVRSFMTPGYDLRRFMRQAIPQISGEDKDYLRFILDDGVEAKIRSRGPGQDSSAPLRKADSVLSRRELEVLDLVEQGQSNWEIGQRLFISDLTVKKHVGSILGKIGVNNRTEAALWARKHRSA